MPKSLLSTFTYFMALNPCNNAIKMTIFILILPIEKTFGSHTKWPKFKPNLSDPVPPLFNPSALLLLEVQLTVKVKNKSSWSSLTKESSGIPSPHISASHIFFPTRLPPPLYPEYIQLEIAVQSQNSCNLENLFS